MAPVRHHRRARRAAGDLRPDRAEAGATAADLSTPEFERVLVFTRTKHGADKVVKNLLRAGIDAAAIHGNKSQSQRERALAPSRMAQRVLIATTSRARHPCRSGHHVVNYDLPTAESYVHRIGRRARRRGGHRRLPLQQRGAGIPKEHREADADEFARQPLPQGMSLTTETPRREGRERQRRRSASCAEAGE